MGRLCGQAMNKKVDPKRKKAIRYEEIGNIKREFIIQSRLIGSGYALFSAHLSERCGPWRLF
ncbi:MAG: hypothetical protein ACE5DW_06145 [Thermodesulfobacteriota bacterium]